MRPQSLRLLVLGGLLRRLFVVHGQGPSKGAVTLDGQPLNPA